MTAQGLQGTGSRGDYNYCGDVPEKPFMGQRFQHTLIVSPLEARSIMERGIVANRGVEWW